MPDPTLIPVRAEAFPEPLPNFSKQVAGKGFIKIVAIGSSSTAGEGGIVPYPSRLQDLLRQSNECKDRAIVLNRGIGGQEAPEELERLQADVIDEKPALAIWQVGSNAVWKRSYNLAEVAKRIADGLALLAASSPKTDVVLMDLQYVPALLSGEMIKDTYSMLSLIDKVAAEANPPVNVFHRFEMMRKWHLIEKRSFDTLVNAEDDSRLHQSDYATQRVAKALCDTILARVASK
jgi:hypothetical protein